MTDSPEQGIKGSSNIQFSPALREFAGQLDDSDVVSLGAMRMLRELSDPDISPKELAQKVRADPALTARILRLSNSAYYGLSNKVSRINQAVTLLGVEDIRSLIQSTCLYELSVSKSGKTDLLGGLAFSAHALAVSRLARSITHRFRFQVMATGEAETAALLHDIGLCLLQVGDPEKLQEVFSVYAETSQAASGTEAGPAFHTIENQVLGFTHAELGAWLAAKWDLPITIQESLLYHNGAIWLSLNKELVTVIQLANKLCNENWMDFLPPGACGALHESVREFIDGEGKLETLDSLSIDLADDIEKTKSLFEMVRSDRDIDFSEVTQPEPTRPDIEEVSEAPASVPIPSWAFFVPGMPQIIAGDEQFGKVLLGLSAAMLLLTLITGIMGKFFFAALGVVVFAACWICSILKG